MHLFLVLTLMALASGAGARPLAGRVLELGTPDGLAGAFIAASPTGASARSDPDGRYTLDLPEGWTQLRVEADGFVGRSLALAVSAATRSLPEIWLKRSVVELEPVRVRARREEAPSRTPLKREEIRRIPGIGRDPLRALQTLPGVAAPSDFSGLLAVRGGGPNDNAYYLNEIPFPVPFHYGGAISTVHSDLLESVDLYPAAFPARWGGVSGAILDARSRPIHRDRLHLQGDFNLLLAELLIEGPFGGGSAAPRQAPASEPASSVQAVTATSSVQALAGAATAAEALAGLEKAAPQPSGAWLASYRRSYYEWLLPQLGDRFTAVPRFWDAGGMAELDLGPQDRLRLSLLATDDILGLEFTADDVQNKDFVGEFRFRNWFGSAGLNWTHHSGAWRSVLTPYWLSNGIEQSIGSNTYYINIHPTQWGLKEDLELRAGAHEIRLGGEFVRLIYDVFGYIFRRRSADGTGVVTLSDPAGITLTAYSSVGSAYLQDRVRLGAGFDLTAGLRWQAAEAMGKEAWDPRVAVEWSAGSATRVSLGWGLFHQYPTPQQLSADFGNPAVDFNEAEHSTLGVEQGLGPGTLLKLEGYYKTYRKLIVQVPDSRLYANDGEGFARGLELMLKRQDDGRWFGWISASLTQSWRLERGGDWVRYQYDQPFNVNIVGSYRFTPAWSTGLRLNWHSGPLITPVVLPGVETPPGSGNYVLTPAGPPWSERLEDYLRLDLRGDYAFRLRGWKLNLYAELINALGRDNPSGVTYNKNYTVRENVNNLPRLPYLGLGVEF